MDLLLNLDVPLIFSFLSFLKNHFHLIFLLKLEMSLCKSTSLIEEGVGENPNLFFNTFNFDGEKVLTQIHNVSRVSKIVWSPRVKSRYYSPT